jgi:hypothetical protein
MVQQARKAKLNRGKGRKLLQQAEIGEGGAVEGESIEGEAWCAVT